MVAGEIFFTKCLSLRRFLEFIEVALICQELCVGYHVLQKTVWHWSNIIIV
jgi:hypothetical protein